MYSHCATLSLALPPDADENTQKHTERKCSKCYSMATDGACGSLMLHNFNTQSRLQPYSRVKLFNRVQRNKGCGYDRPSFSCAQTTFDSIYQRPCWLLRWFAEVALGVILFRVDKTETRRQPCMCLWRVKAGPIIFGLVVSRRVSRALSHTFCSFFLLTHKLTHAIRSRIDWYIPIYYDYRLFLQRSLHDQYAYIDMHRAVRRECVKYTPK